jgi:hypothetical protein
MLGKLPLPVDEFNIIIFSSLRRSRNLHYVDAQGTYSADALTFVTVII